MELIPTIRPRKGGGGWGVGGGFSRIWQRLISVWKELMEPGRDGSQRWGQWGRRGWGRLAVIPMRLSYQVCGAVRTQIAQCGA